MTRTYPKRPTNHSPLFGFADDFARMQYNKNMSFRNFVHEWNADAPELLDWSLADFYLAYQSGGVAQLKLSM